MSNIVTIFVNVSHLETQLGHEICIGHNAQTSNGAQRRSNTNNSLLYQLLKKRAKEKPLEAFKHYDIEPIKYINN